MHDAGAYSIAHSDRHGLIFSGGKKGAISLIDVRQRANIFNIPAHQKKVTSLRVDEETGSLVSGSADGQVKIWSINAILEVMPTVIATPASFNPSLISETLETPASLKTALPAIMQVEVQQNGVFICDVDGIRRFRGRDS